MGDAVRAFGVTTDAAGAGSCGEVHGGLQGNGIGGFGVEQSGFDFDAAMAGWPTGLAGLDEIDWGFWQGFMGMGDFGVGGGVGFAR